MAGGADIECRSIKFQSINSVPIPPDNRRKIYELIKQHRSKLDPLIENLENSLAETTSLIGWALDPDLLSQALRARSQIRKYRALTLDDTDACSEKAVEYIIDIDTMTQVVREILRRLGGIED